MTLEQRIEALEDLAAVERELAELSPRAKRKRADLMLRRAVLGRKLWPGKCERYGF